MRDGNEIGRARMYSCRRHVRYLLRQIVSCGSCMSCDFICRGLGKTIQAIALIWTLLSSSRSHSLLCAQMSDATNVLIEQSPYFGNGPVIERAVVVCPVTLVKVCGVFLIYSRQG